MTIDPSNVPGQQSNVDPATNPQPNVGISGLNVDPSTPTIEELQRQLDEFKNSNFELREKERKRKEQAAADKAALEAKLKEQGEFKTLAEQLAEEKQRLEQEIAQRDAEIAKRDYEALRARVATKHGLAPELAIRLSGQTEEELNADATALKKLIGEQTQQARLPGNGPGPKPAGQLTPEQQAKEAIQKHRASGHYSKF